MKIKYLFAIGFAALASGYLSAQNNTPVLGCGVGLEEGAMIIERLEENRRTISPEQIQQVMNARAIQYIPTKVHIIGDDNGSGYADIDNVLASICDLNNDYATQDIKFYLKDVSNTFHYFNSTTLYNNGSSFSSQGLMYAQKSPNSVNIFTSRSVNAQVASYYSPTYDFVFMLNQMANGTSSTSSHEVGHFFSLPHTFYGWENIDVTPYGTGNVPSSVNGAPTERADRSGACSNCTTAGDRFCDTPADYTSDRAACPFNQGVKDNCGNAIDPEESLIMSYYFDPCVDSFTPEQKGAIIADLLNRQSLPSSNFKKFNATNAAPTPNNFVTGSGITANSPVNNSSVALGDVTVTWAPVTGATAYVVSVERSIFGSPIAPISKTIVYGSNSYTIPASSLEQSREYTWKVKPFNQASTCGAYSSGFIFNTNLISGIEASFNETAELVILSNPVNGTTAELSINVPEALTAGIKLYSLDGRLLSNAENVVLNAGDNIQMLDITTLNAGMYMVVVSTEKGTMQQKLVVTK